MTQPIEIVFSDDDIVVVRKTNNLPSAPLTENDCNNALYYASQQFPEILKVTNTKKEIEHGLIHRIDNDTEGLLLFAKNDFSWNKLQLFQNEDKFIKGYTAYCNSISIDKRNVQGFPECYCAVNPEKIISVKENHSIKVNSFFRNYGQGRKETRPLVSIKDKTYSSKKAYDKEYETEIIKIEKISDNNYKVECKIAKGFKHQVRCHLAWIGLPVINDKIYNSENCINGECMKFYASYLEFPHPKTNQIKTFSIPF